MQKPIENYPGSKGGSGVAKRIISMMPPHRVYIEAFLGGGAVLQLKKPAALSIGLDLSPSVIRAWQPAATPGLTLEYSLQLAADGVSSNAPGLEKNRHLLRVTSSAAFSTREASLAVQLPADSGGPGEVGRPIGSLAAFDGADVGLPLGHHDLMGVETPRALTPDLTITAVHAASDGARGNCRQPPLCVAMVDAVEWIASSPAVLQDPRTLLYCDPPYLRSVRTRLFYDCELGSPEEHACLLKAVLGLRCNVMMSHYPCSLYDGMLAGWRRETFRAMTRGGPRIEAVYMNFPEPTVFHDARFLGNGFRERERIKRKSKRWRARFQAMSAAERQVVRTALDSVDRASPGAAL